MHCGPMIGLACFGFDLWVHLSTPWTWVACSWVFQQLCWAVHRWSESTAVNPERFWNLAKIKKKTATATCLYATGCFLFVFFILHNHWIYLLQRVEDSKRRDGHHGQQAVAQDTGHAAVRHGQGTHQTQQNVHPNTGCSAGPIHITEVSFTCLNMWE